MTAALGRLCDSKVIVFCICGKIYFWKFLITFVVTLGSNFNLAMFKVCSNCLSLAIYVDFVQCHEPIFVLKCSCPLVHMRT